jgi:hypothetical protein
LPIVPPRCRKQRLSGALFYIVFEMLLLRCAAFLCMVIPGIVRIVK